MEHNRFIIKKVSGFTLVELMTVICILFIILMIAIPNFMQWQANYRFRNALVDLYSNLHRARSVAMRHRCLGTVTFLQSIPPGSSDQPYDYVVFIDKNSNMELEPDEVGGIIAKVKWSDYINVEFGTQSDDGITFTDNNEGLPAVAFRPNGLPRNNTGGFGSGSVFIKNTKNNVVKSVKLAKAGRIRIAN